MYNLTLLDYKKTLLTFSEAVDYPTIKDYEGQWILIENGKSVGLITAEIRSETKLTVSYHNSFMGSWSKSYSYKNHYITLDDWKSEHLGILKSDGKVTWKWPGGEMGMTRTWRRPDASDYIGNWIAIEEDEESPVFCEQFNVKQLICHYVSLTRADAPSKFLLDVDEGTLRLIDDEIPDTVGKLQGDGSINWFMKDIYFLTWERKGKLFAF